MLAPNCKIMSQWWNCSIIDYTIASRTISHKIWLIWKWKFDSWKLMMKRFEWCCGKMEWVHQVAHGNQRINQSQFWICQRSNSLECVILNWNHDNWLDEFDAWIDFEFWIWMTCGWSQRSWHDKHKQTQRQIQELIIPNMQNVTDAHNRKNRLTIAQRRNSEQYWPEQQHAHDEKDETS